MLNIRGMSIVEKLLRGVNRFGYCLTKSSPGAAHEGRDRLERLIGRYFLEKYFTLLIFLKSES